MNELCVWKFFSLSISVHAHGADEIVHFLMKSIENPIETWNTTKNTIYISEYSLCFLNDEKFHRNDNSKPAKITYKVEWKRFVSQAQTHLSHSWTANKCWKHVARSIVWAEFWQSVRKKRNRTHTHALGDIECVKGNHREQCTNYSDNFTSFRDCRAVVTQQPCVDLCMILYDFKCIWIYRVRNW